MKDYRKTLKSNNEINDIMSIDQDLLWDNIEKKMDKPKKDRKRFFIWMFSAVLIFISFVSFTIYSVLQEEQENILIANKNKTIELTSRHGIINTANTNSDVYSIGTKVAREENQERITQEAIDLKKRLSSDEYLQNKASDLEKENFHKISYKDLNKVAVINESKNSEIEKNGFSNVHSQKANNSVVDFSLSQYSTDHSDKDNQEIYKPQNSIVLNKVGLVDNRMKEISVQSLKSNYKDLLILDEKYVSFDKMTFINQKAIDFGHKLVFNIDLSAYNKSYQSKTGDLSELFNFKNQTELGLEGYNISLTYAKAILHPNVFLYTGLNLTRLNENLVHTWIYTDVEADAFAEGRTNVIQVNASYFNHYLFLNAPIGIEYVLSLNEKLSINTKLGVNLNLYKNQNGEYFDKQNSAIRSKAVDFTINNTSLGFDGLHFNVGTSYQFKPSLFCHIGFDYRKYSNELVGVSNFSESFNIYSVGLGVYKRF